MHSILKKKYIFTMAMFFPLLTFAQPDDCINEAAHCFQIPPLVIKAIIWKESKNMQNVITRNKNHSIDLGIMQINSLHFSMLESIGISEDELRKNSCANVFSGVWVLNQAIRRYGYTWEGIGNYHSRTSPYHDKYVSSIISIISRDLNVLNGITVAYQHGIREKFTCK